MARRSTLVDHLRGQLRGKGIDDVERFSDSTFTPLTEDVLGYVSGGDFSEFTSYTQTMTDGSTRFSLVWNHRPL